MDHNGVLLTPADRRIAARMSRDEFETILVHSLLFEQQIVISDTYYFNSPHLLAHLKSRKTTTLLEAAIRRGLIRTAVRERSSSFSDIYSYLRRDGVAGLLSQSDAAYVAGRLDQSASSGQFDLLWPEKMADSYHALLKAALQVEHPPQFQGIGVAEPLWTKTERYRFESLELGSDLASQRPGNFGIRRSDVLVAVAQTVGLTAPSSGAPSEESIVAAAGRDGATVARFIDWLDDLYFANQALRFGLRAPSSTQNPSDIALIANAIGMTEQNSTTASEILSVDIEVPTLSVLSNLDADTFLSLRSSGCEWYGAGNRFLTEPTPSNRASAEAAITDFASAVRRETNEHRPHISNVKAAAGAFGLAATGSVGLVVPFAESASIIGSAVYAGILLSSWVRRNPVEKIHFSQSGGAASFISLTPDGP